MTLVIVVRPSALPLDAYLQNEHVELATVRESTKSSGLPY